MFLCNNINNVLRWREVLLLESNNSMILITIATVGSSCYRFLFI